MLRHSSHRLKPYLRRRIFLVTLQMSHFPIWVPMQTVSAEGVCVVFSLLTIILVTHVLAKIFGWLLRWKVSFERVEEHVFYTMQWCWVYDTLFGKHSVDVRSTVSSLADKQ